ncbi:hypothetical protein SteCoe_7296 [Stentor coeruleus]|uniref:Uncharacterized protein n=1 Tax=Stentor coeruleus TaxID=5963 RepID=A0A1R2CN64_9CILI|nr:hypothetical protein SteCoe_7296 [Stentor coeruleus]
MSCNQCICQNCKKPSYSNSKSTQTESSYAKTSLIPSSPPPLGIFTTSQPGRIVKIKPCKGDIDVHNEIFEDCDLSSICENDSLNCISYRKSILKDEPNHFVLSVSTKDELTESIRIKNAFSITARQTPDLYHKFEESSRAKAKTPSIYMYDFTKSNYHENDYFTQSYENMLENCSYKDSDEFRECFKNLVMIEKKSLQESFFRQPVGRRH